MNIKKDTYHYITFVGVNKKNNQNNMIYTDKVYHNINIGKTLKM